MKNQKRKGSNRAGFKLTLLVALVCLCVLAVTLGSILAYGGKSRNKDNADQGQNGRPSEIDRIEQSTSSRESSNISLLNSLLSIEGVNVDEKFLLPAQVGSARTALVRFESQVKSLSRTGFLEHRPAGGSLSLIDVKSSNEGLTRQRTLELSTTQVLVIATNKSKTLLWWTLVPDPILFRAETSDDAGKLSGQKLYRTSGEMLVSYPADGAITELRFYHPSWDGQSFGLEQIGLLSLPPAE